MDETLHTAVIGGGITGLCAGWHAARRFGPERVRVFEKATRPGGTTLSDAESGYTLDWGPNGFLDREPATLEWVDALGVSGELQRANAAAAKRFIFKGGQLHQVKGPPAFLASPLLSLLGRVRLCCEPLIPPRRDHAGETIHAFAARRIGREAADLLVGPMVSGVFGGDARQLSLEHCFPRMAAMEREHGGLVRALMARRKTNPGASPAGPSGTLTTLAGGIGRLPEIVAEQLGDTLLTGHAVRRVDRDGAFFRVLLADGTRCQARNVIVACPAFAAAPMIEGLAPEAAKALLAIPYSGLAVVCAGYRRDRVGHSLDGFGFLVPRGQGPRLLGCLWTSSLFPGQAPKGRVLLRTMLGGATDPDLLHLSDEVLIATTERELCPLLGIVGQPELLRVFRHPRGIPQYTLGHGERLAALEVAEAQHPGLFFAGNAYRGVGLNDCVLSALRAVERLVMA